MLAKVRARVSLCLLEKVEGEAILSNTHLEINGRSELSPPSLPKDRGYSSVASSPLLILSSLRGFSTSSTNTLVPVQGAGDHMLCTKIEAQQRCSIT